MASALIIVLGALSALHLYWGFGGRWPGTDEPSLVAIVIGRTKTGRMPSLAMCAIVAFGLAFGAWSVAAFNGDFRFGVSWPLVNFVYFMLALGFALRGALGYFPGVFDYAKGTPFYRLNRLYYSPLCLAIAFGLMIASMGLL